MRRARGFSLLEILAVVAVIAIGVSLLIVRQAAAERRTDAAALARDLVTFADAVKAGHASLDWRGFDTAGAFDHAPAHWRVARPSDLRHQFGGAVTYSVSSYQGLANRALTITLASVPRAVCSRTLQDAGPRFARVTAGAVVLKSEPNDTISSNAAAAACTSPTTTLQWVLL